MIKILGGVIAGFAVFIILIFAISACSKKTYTYETLEAKMVDITKGYYQENPDELPKEDKDSKTFTLKKMITGGYLDEVVKLFDNEKAKCDGSVTVTNTNGYYLYTPYLSCSGVTKEDYESQYLVDKVIEDNLVEEGIGLYEVGDKYIFKGETKNNFVKFSDSEKLFRIIGINEDGTLRLFEVSGLKRIVWDNRYNEERGYASGFNEYYLNSLDSIIKQKLDEYYNDTATWTDDMKAYMLTQDVCIGKRNAEDQSRDGVIECSRVVEGQVFALLRTDEFLSASLDATCENTLDKSCKNYNWFNTFNTSIWTSIADATTSHRVFKLSTDIILSTATSPGGANVVINITDKAVYSGGTGTETDPYVFR